MRYGVSRKTYYKWMDRYKQKGIEGLSDISRRPHNIKYKKVMPEVEEEIIDLRLTKRFGCNRIKFRLRRIIGLSLSTRTIYKIRKRHGLNILKCNAKIRTYKRFAANFVKKASKILEEGDSILSEVARGIYECVNYNEEPRSR